MDLCNNKIHTKTIVQLQERNNSSCARSWRLKLLYDWRSVSQYVLVSSTLVGPATRYYFLSECWCLKFAVLFLWGALSDERTGSAICSVITHWSKFHRTRNHTLLPHLRLPQPGGPGSHLHIPQEQGGPVIHPCSGFPLRRLLQLAGLR
jgi:hypothetical protein